jgi:hypothetical protein
MTNVIGNHIYLRLKKDKDDPLHAMGMLGGKEV